MKLYTMDFDWKGGYAVIANSPEEALRKMKELNHQEREANRHPPGIDPSELTLGRMEETSQRRVFRFLGET